MKMFYFSQITHFSSPPKVPEVPEDPGVPAVCRGIDYSVLDDPSRNINYGNFVFFL